MKTLYRHQQAIVDMAPKRHLWAWQPRTGKTYPAITLMNKVGRQALIIVPKQLFKQWEGLLKEHATVSWNLMTKETFRTQAKELISYDTVIVDESHHFSGMKSELSKQLERYIKRHNPEYVWLLTGTPYRSTPWNIYRLATILGHKWDYMDFRRNFFKERYMGRGVVYVPRADCQDELADLVREIGSIVRLEDCTDMPTDPEPVVEKLPITKEQTDLIEEITKRESNPLVRFGSYHQAASGLSLGNEFVAPREVPCAKDARIVEYIEQYDRVLIFCRYNQQIYRYEKMLKALNIPAVIINGATKDVDAAREEARDMKYGAVLINMSCSEGYALDNYSVTIYASLSYSFLDFEQSQGRTKHLEKKVPNFYVILNTEGSADEPVWDAIKDKRSFSESIFVREHMVG